MQFGVMFFAADCNVEAPHSLLLEVARFADRHGFTCIWTPERHFSPFGGLFPNPSVLSAALAMITERLQLRSGSLISPLHDAIRIAEEWSLVDQLSAGRVAISFGSGWNVNDFVFFPERYDTRRQIMYERIDTIRALWRGEPMTRKNTFGKEVALTLYPKPVQPELPIWITSSGNVDTFRSAGSWDANVLTHMITQDIYTLKNMISVYRRAGVAKGLDPLEGIVSLMLHTFLGDAVEDVKKIVYDPFREYLRSAIDLEQLAAQGGGVISGGLHHTGEALPPRKWKNCSTSPLNAILRLPRSWAPWPAPRNSSKNSRSSAWMKLPAWLTSALPKSRSWRALSTWSRSRTGLTSTNLSRTIPEESLMTKVYVFPGQGSQRKGMGAQLFKVFQAEL
jgi:natural product biosynthesis luciferase-like monooxygenase protein